MYYRKPIFHKHLDSLSHITILTGHVIYCLFLLLLLADCNDEDVVIEKCWRNPTVDDINISDDYWRSDLESVRKFSPDIPEATGLDSFPFYTRHSWP